MKKLDSVSVSKENRLRGRTKETTAAAKAFKRITDAEIFRNMLKDELRESGLHYDDKRYIIEKGEIKSATAVFTDVYFDYFAAVSIRLEQKYFGIVDATIFVDVMFDGEHIAIKRSLDSNFVVYKVVDEIIK